MNWVEIPWWQKVRIWMIRKLAGKNRVILNWESNEIRDCGIRLPLIPDSSFVLVADCNFNGHYLYGIHQSESVPEEPSQP